MRVSNASLFFLVCSALAACSSPSTQAGTTPPIADGGIDADASTKPPIGDGGIDSQASPVVCCDVPATPPSCGDERYGGEKTSDPDSCIIGFDGLIPDPQAPGWTLAKDDAGCPIWVPPTTAASIQCGVVIAPDAGTDSGPLPDGGAAPDSGGAPDAGSD